MNTELERRKQEITRTQGRRKLWQRIVSALAAVVMFVTTYVLILPVEAQNRTFCEMEAHEHSAENGCYVETKTLKCEEKHEHTDECYITLLTLICQHEEHIHNKECYADKTADIETQADWEKSVEAATLTGEWSKDIIAIANTQLGYRESDKNYIVNEENEIQGYNRYAAWVSSTNAEFGQYSPWSAAFVAFCLHFAGVSEDAMQRTPYPAQWGELMKAYEKLNADAKNAQPGDILFIDANDDEIADRVAIVVENNDGKIKAVEGDLNNSVAYAEYRLPAAAGDSRTDRADVDFAESKSTTGRTVGKIIGFVAMPENPDYTAPIDSLDPSNTDTPDNRIKETAAPDEQKIELTAETENGLTVALSAPASAFDAPADRLKLIANEINDEKALELLKRAAAGEFDPQADQTDVEFSNENSDNSVDLDATVKASLSTLLLDVKLLYNDTEIQPQEGKAVTLTLSGDALPGGYAQVFSLDLDKDTAENMYASSDESGLFFNAPRFSIFGVKGSESSKDDPVFRVFQNETDKFVTFSGLSYCYLVGLMQNLDISINGANIASVVSSAPAYISAEAVTNNYKITRLRAIGTNATVRLKVTMRNGNVYNLYWTCPGIRREGTASSKIVVGSANENFANILPLATATLLPSRMNIANARLISNGGYSARIYTAAQFEATGLGGTVTSYLILDFGNTISQPGQIYSFPNAVTVEYSNAAILGDGRFAAVRETWSDLRIQTKSDFSGTIRWVAIARNENDIVFNQWYSDKRIHTKTTDDYSTLARQGRVSISIPAASTDDTVIVKASDLDTGFPHKAFNNWGYGEYYYQWYNTASKAVFASDGCFVVNSENTSANADGLGAYSRISTHGTRANTYYLLAKASEFGCAFQPWSLSTLPIQSTLVRLRPLYRLYENGTISGSWLGAQAPSTDKHSAMANSLKGKLRFKDITSGVIQQVTATWQGISYDDDGYILRTGVPGKRISVSYDNVPGYYVRYFRMNGSDLATNSSYTANLNTTDLKFDVYYEPIMGTIAFKKVDARTGEPLEGAVFTLTGTSSYHGAFNLASVDLGDGNYEIRNVPMGSVTDIYTLSETQVPPPTTNINGDPLNYLPAAPITFTGSQFNINGVVVNLANPIPDPREGDGFTLTLTEEIIGGESDTAFPFTINITDETGNNIYQILDENITVYHGGIEVPMSTIPRDSNGNPVIELGDGWSVVIEKIPANYIVTITETGFSPYYTCDISGTAGVEVVTPGSGVTKPIVMDSDKTVNYLNTRGTSDITITKKLVGRYYDTKFPFSVLVKDEQNQPVRILDDISTPAKYTVGDAASGYEVTFLAGHNETVTLYGIPDGSTVTLRETSHEGFVVIIKEGDVVLANVDNTSFTVNSRRDIVVYNNAGFELPHTGGGGTLILTFSGAILMATALTYGMAVRRRRERREFTY